MEKVHLLCEVNRYVLEEFSRRTVEGLKANHLFRIILGPFQSFLEINVLKEIEKDRLVIQTAAKVHSEGRAITESDIRELLNKSRGIDSAFVQRAALFPVRIDIRSPEVQQYRKERITVLAHAVYRLLVEWGDTLSFRRALARCYSPEQFEKLLGNILHLYTQETKMLSGSLRMPRPFAMATDSMAQLVYRQMESSADVLASELTQRTYRQRV